MDSVSIKTLYIILILNYRIKLCDNSYWLYRKKYQREKSIVLRFFFFIFNWAATEILL